jgi:hypothetical protein
VKVEETGGVKRGSKYQCCIFRFGTRFGLAIGTEYFGTGPFRRSVSGLPQIFIYI